MAVTSYAVWKILVCLFFLAGGGFMYVCDFMLHTRQRSGGKRGVIKNGDVFPQENTSLIVPPSLDDC